MVMVYIKRMSVRVTMRKMCTCNTMDQFKYIWMRWQNNGTKNTKKNHQPSNSFIKSHLNKYQRWNSMYVFSFLCNTFYSKCTCNLLKKIVIEREKIQQQAWKRSFSPLLCMHMCVCSFSCGFHAEMHYYNMDSPSCN